LCQFSAQKVKGQVKVIGRQEHIKKWSHIWRINGFTNGQWIPRRPAG